MKTKKKQSENKTEEHTVEEEAENKVGKAGEEVIERTRRKAASAT